MTKEIFKKQEFIKLYENFDLEKYMAQYEEDSVPFQAFNFLEYLIAWQKKPSLEQQLEELGYKPRDMVEFFGVGYYIFEDEVKLFSLQPPHLPDNVFYIRYNGEVDNEKILAKAKIFKELVEK